MSKSIIGEVRAQQKSIAAQYQEQLERERLRRERGREALLPLKEIIDELAAAGAKVQPQFRRKGHSLAPTAEIRTVTGDGPYHLDVELRSSYCFAPVVSPNNEVYLVKVGGVGVEHNQIALNAARTLLINLAAEQLILPTPVEVEINDYENKHFVTVLFTSSQHLSRDEFQTLLQNQYDHFGMSGFFEVKSWECFSGEVVFTRFFDEDQYVLAERYPEAKLSEAVAAQITDELKQGGQMPEFEITGIAAHRLDAAPPGAPDTEESLTREWTRWCATHGLVCRSANDLLRREEDVLTDSQKTYIREFITRWEETVETPVEAVAG